MKIDQFENGIEAILKKFDLKFSEKDSDGARFCPLSNGKEVYLVNNGSVMIYGISESNCAEVTDQKDLNVIIISPDLKLRFYDTFFDYDKPAVKNKKLLDPSIKILQKSEDKYDELFFESKGKKSAPSGLTEAKRNLLLKDVLYEEIYQFEKKSIITHGQEFLSSLKGYYKRFGNILLGIE